MFVYKMSKAYDNMKLTRRAAGALTRSMTSGTRLGGALRAVQFAGKLMRKINQYRQSKYANKERSNATGASGQGKLDKLHEGHVRYLKSSVTYGTKVSRKRKGKSRKRRKKRVRKMTHGRKIEIDVFSLGFVYPADNSTKSSNSFTGKVISVANKGNFAFLPVLNDTTVQNMIKYGESTDQTGKSGILDPAPSRIYSGSNLSNVAHNFVKVNEKIMFDKYLICIDLVNTNNTKFMLDIQEWICNDSSDVNIIKRCFDEYHNQTLTNGLQTSDMVNLAISATSMFQNPAFSMGKVPGFSKFWKQGKFHKKVELLPGEEIKVYIPIKKLMWDLSKFDNETEAGTGPWQYHKNISRYIAIKTVSGLGFNSESGNTVLPTHSYNFRVNHKITYHRVEDLEPQGKQYYPTVPGLVLNINGSSETGGFDTQFVTPTSGSNIQFNSTNEPNTGDFT